jgi:inner membrane protein
MLAMLPDIDLVYQPMHRTGMHSVGAAIAVLIVAAGVTRWVTGRIDSRVSLLCATAYSTHILLDWLGTDPFGPSGIQALWPFSREWFVSPVAVFPGTERRHLLSWATFFTNARAAAFEIVVIGSLAIMIRWIGAARTRARQDR